MRFSLHYKISKVFLQEFWLFFGGKTLHLELPLHNLVGFSSPITWVFSSCISSFTENLYDLYDNIWYLSHDIIMFPGSAEEWSNNHNFFHTRRLFFP